MQLLVEPPFDQWHLSDLDPAGRTEIVQTVNEHAHRLGTGRLDALRPIIATGHQPWLWHPGILAKDLAMAAAAKRLHAGILHVVVDQDDCEALRVELPVRRNDLLSIEKLDLANYDRAVPTGCQPPADANEVLRNLQAVGQRLGDTLAADVRGIAEAFSGLPPCRTLAEQLTIVLMRLRRPHLPPLPVLFATDLPGLPGYQSVVDAMLLDPARCAECYNRAVRAHPDAAVAPLRVQPHRVELPLWKLGWRQPRRRVFAHLSNRGATLTIEGTPTNDTGDSGFDRATLAPRALLLSAYIRSTGCNLFIHGRGGKLYDRATEQWWQEWRGQTLAPKAIVSADLTMKFAVPVADQRAVDRAVWWAHHLPHNLDRALGLDTETARRKHQLLNTLMLDRDRQRKAWAFEQVHQINRDLATAHDGALAEADARIALARTGVANRAVAQKRDWCFALYRQEEIRSLADSIENQLAGNPGQQP